MISSKPVKWSPIFRIDAGDAAPLLDPLFATHVSSVANKGSAQSSRRFMNNAG